MNSMCFEVSNPFKGVVDHHYKVVSHEFDVFSKVSNLFELPVDHHYKVVSHEFDAFRKFRICSKH